MKAINFLIAGALMMALPLAAHAQFDTGGGTTSSSSSPWKDLKLNPKTRIKLDFKNAKADMVIDLLSKTSGVTIVKDPTFKAPITISSAKPVPLEEAFQIFSTVVNLAGYDFKKEGNVMVIRKRPERGNPGGGGPTMIPGMPQGNPGGGMPGGFPGGMPGGMNIGGGGAAQNAVLKVYPIAHANASAVARVVNEVYANMAGVQRGGGFPFGGPFQVNQGGGPQQQQQAGRQGPTVRASSDDFSNSVIVYAPSKEQEQVEELIKKIDKQNSQPEETKIYPLTYASAEEMAPTIQNVLVNNAPRGRGGGGNQNVPFEQRFQQAVRFGSAASSFGTVSADPRTNSLVVTATPENQLTVGKVIADLDKPVEIQNSAVVIPLDNARADSMADLLNSAFGSRGNNFGGFNNNNRFGGNQGNRGGNNNNRFGGNQNRNFGGGGGRAQQPNPNELEVPLEDPEAESGPLATQVFFGGFGGQQNNNRRNQQGPARDAQGRITNLRDLAGQVSIIADPNTNSLIIIGSPENADLVRSIIEQLDKIPEQVMIETIIVEASLDASTKMGIEWQFSQDRAFGKNNTTGSGNVNFGLPSAITGSGFRYTITGQNFQAFINALKTDQRFSILSTPRIFTSNNVEAEINISQRVPFVVSQREDANGNLTFNYDFEDVGIVLTVTPRISANGTVTMDVVQTANDLQGFTDFNAPIVNQREAQTTVSVKDGETIVLGGIMRTTVNSTVRKVPLLGDIPILGELFKSTDRTKQKTELLVFLTPRIVRNPEEAKKLREDTQKEMSPASQKAIQGAIDKKGTNGGGPK